MYCEYSGTLVRGSLWFEHSSGWIVESEIQVSAVVTTTDQYRIVWLFGYNACAFVTLNDQLLQN